MPKGATIESWNVGLGGSVSSTTALATVDYPRDLIAEAQVTQADVPSLKVGQKAACTIDGETNGSFDGSANDRDRASSHRRPHVRRPEMRQDRTPLARTA